MQQTQGFTEFIVAEPDTFGDLCTQLANSPVLAFDTEFIGERTYHPRLCLIQVAIPGQLFLIDPLTVGPVERFWNLLLDSTRMIVVHAGREEIRLCRQATGQTPVNLIDLQLAAGLVGLHYPLGHSALMNHLVGARLSKGETLTEWDRRPLTPEQIRYAFDDVRYLLAAWQKVQPRLERLGRLDWALEEFQRLKSQAVPEEVVEERWRKLRGISSLDRRKLAVVRALFSWRDQEASRTNRPVRQIIRDDLIAEIARRTPTQGKDLEVVRGLPHRDLDAIVEVSRKARELPPEEWPMAFFRDQDPPQVALVSAVLSAVLGDLCGQLKLAQSLVASANEVKSLVRARLSGAALPSGRLTQGWRAKHILPELLAILDGQRVVRIASLKSASPFAYVDVGEKKE